MFRSLSCEDRRECLDAFSKARAHLLCYLTLKLAHWATAPWMLYQTVQTNENLAREACSKLLRIRSSHPAVCRLQMEPLLSQALQWLREPEISILDSKDLHDLSLYLARFKFAFVAERKVEGQHRLVKMRGIGAPCHSCPYVSFGLRKHEVHDSLSKQPAWISELADLLYSTRTAKKALHCLGLEKHPSLHNCVPSPTASTIVKVIYHADPTTLYGPPQLCLQYPDGGDEHDDDKPTVTFESFEKVFLIEHVRSVISELQGEDKLHFIMAKMEAPAFQLLGEAMSSMHLREGGAEEQDSALDLLAVGGQPLAQSSAHANTVTYFFTPLSLHPKRFKRPDPNDDSIASTDLLVQMSEFADATHRTCIKTSDSKKVF
eukprot:6456587-Amphidinium_carterae.2